MSDMKDNEKKNEKLMKKKKNDFVMFTIFGSLCLIWLIACWVLGFLFGELVSRFYVFIGTMMMLLLSTIFYSLAYYSHKRWQDWKGIFIPEEIRRKFQEKFAKELGDTPEELDKMLEDILKKEIQKAKLKQLCENFDKDNDSQFQIIITCFLEIDEKFAFEKLYRFTMPKSRFFAKLWTEGKELPDPELRRIIVLNIQDWNGWLGPVQNK